MQMKCKCGYQWIARVQKPKKCPKCLKWVEYKEKKNDNVK